MNRRMRLQNYQRTFLRVNPPPLLSFASRSSCFFRFFFPLLLLPSFSFCFSSRPDTRRVDESFVMNENATYLRCATRYVIRHVKEPEGTIASIGNIVVQYVIAFCSLFSLSFIPACVLRVQDGEKWVRHGSEDPVLVAETL